MLDSETKRRIDSLRDILVSKISSPEGQVEQITIGLMYKFMNDMDKQNAKPSYFAGKFKKYAWDKLIDKSLEGGGTERVRLYSEGIEMMKDNEKLPKVFRNMFKNSYLPFNDPQTVNMFLTELDHFDYSNSEKLGDAYEYLLSFMGSQGNIGQFRTPRHIIDFMVEVVDPKLDEKILDPACGTAGFLISSYKHILKNNSKISYDAKKKLMDNLIGYDIEFRMIRISLVNMYLHQFTTPQIYEYDTLSDDSRWNEHYHVILANPPFFSPKGGIKPHQRFGVHSTRAEVLFVDYIASHLYAESGRAAIIVPEGIIFQTGTAYRALRKNLVESGLIGVISLPAGVFQPYSGVKTSILILDKKKSRESREMAKAAEKAEKAEKAGWKAMDGAMGASSRGDLLSPNSAGGDASGGSRGKGASSSGDLNSSNSANASNSPDASSHSPNDKNSPNSPNASNSPNFSNDAFPDASSDAFSGGKAGKIFFAKVENDGYSLGAQRTPIDKNDLPKVLEALKRGGGSGELVAWVDKSAVAEKDYILSANSYAVQKEVQTHYDMVALGDVCEVVNGSTPNRAKKIFWEKGTIPWFTVDDLRVQGFDIKFTKQHITKEALEKTSVKLLPVGTTLLCCTASIGACAYSEIPLTTNQQFNGLIVKKECKDKLNSKFLFWMCVNLKDELERNSGGATFSYLSVTKLKAIEIPLPPIGVQEEIVNEVEGYQKIIDGCRMVIANYKPTITIDPAWKMMELGELVEQGIINHRNGSEIKEITKSGIPYIKVSDMNHPQNQDKITTSKNFVSKNYQRKHLVKVGATIFPKVGQAINTDKKRITAVECFVDGNTAIVEILDKNILNEYYFYYCFMGIPLNTMCHDPGGYPSINKEGFSKAKIPIPPKKVQEEIVREIGREGQAINGVKQLMEIFQQKIHSKIAQVWGAP